MTSSSIQQFDFDSNEVRVILHDEEPYFVASDIAKILGYRNAPDMTRNLDDDEKGTQIVRTLGGKQEMTVISEAGLYQAVLKSRVDNAKPFQRWVTHEVLPSIRKHGAYATPATIENIINDPEFGIKLLTKLKDEQAKRIEAEQQVKQLEPKAQLMDEFINLDSTYSVGESAKLLYNAGIHIGPQQLFAVLADLGWIFKREGKWQPKQQRIASGHMALKPYTTEGKHADGSTFKFQPQVRLTGKGIMLLQWTITQRAMQQTLKRAQQTPAQAQTLEA